MKELTIISGKGGTGKTTVTAALAALGDRKVMADCDVDAADLALVVRGEVIERGDFVGGSLAVVRADDCTACGRCEGLCRFRAVRKCGPSNAICNATYAVEPLSCEGCGVCVEFCPVSAVDFRPHTSGEWLISETVHGPLFHASLLPGEGNSGKLVALLREKARRLAAQMDLSLIIADGSPGIGCPVIASITGASLVLVVTEPTLSGIYDLERVGALVQHFDIEALVCVNKWDINKGLAEAVKEYARRSGLLWAGRIRYDEAATRAQLAGVSLIECDGGAAYDVRGVWEKVAACL